MSAGFDGNLSYRDYVVHIFTGILFNVFLVAAFYTPDTILPHSISDILQKLDATTGIILSLVAIPILFLEGHFLLQIDRFLFLELPTWLLECKEYRCSGTDCQNDDINNKTKEKPYYALRKQLYEKHRLLFHLLFTKRVAGQRIIKESKKGIKLVETKDKDKKSYSTRYYELSDFFKGCGAAAWISLVFACIKHNWWCAAILGVVIVLSWLRCRCYSKLYVANCFEKKCSKQAAEELSENNPEKETSATKSEHYKKNLEG